MATLGTSAIRPLMLRDLRRVFIEKGKNRPPEFTKLLNVGSMESNPEKDKQYSGLSVAPEKPEGTQFVLDTPLEGGTRTYTAVSYGKAFEVTHEAWRDDQYGAAREWASELRDGLDLRAELQAASFYNLAFTTTFAGFTAGESLCSTAHVGLDGVTRANRPSPDVALSMTGLQAGTTAFENMTDERNMPRLLRPSLLVIAPENRFVAREILGSTGRPYTADNEINSLIEEDLSSFVHHYFAAANNDFWFLQCLQGDHDLNFRWREMAFLDSFDDPWTMNGIFTGYESFAFGWSSWRGLYGSQAP